MEHGYRVLFSRTTDLVQQMQRARRDLTLANLIHRLDRYHLLILDDRAYVPKDQAETSVLFELIAARYERRSLLITANQPFEAWTRIFPDETTAVAAVDRLVHHATILEMNVESYRRRAALRRKQRPAANPHSPTNPTNSPRSIPQPNPPEPAHPQPQLSPLAILLSTQHHPPRAVPDSHLD